PGLGQQVPIRGAPAVGPLRDGGGSGRAARGREPRRGPGGVPEVREPRRGPGRVRPAVPVRPMARADGSARPGGPPAPRPIRPPERNPPVSSLAEVHARVDARASAHLDLLCDLIRQPSRTGHLDEVERFAERFVAVLTDAGGRAEAVRVDAGAPIVYAEWPAPPGGKTLVLYSHYDVISPEPVDEWTYPPFGATRVDGKIIGRGWTDAKANLLALVKGVETFVELEGSAPCGIRLIVDGEEERGSPNLPLFVDQYAGRLRADGALSFDGGFDARGVPKIGLGTSGMLYVELSVSGARHELHSAGARLFVNPAWRLVWALASIKDADERVLIEGFDGDIAPPSSQDRALMAAMPWDDRAQLREAGVEGFLTGVRGLAAVERLLFQPGLAICGIRTGFTGPGPKAVIPDRASAKLEFRIVPDQTPERVAELLRRHLDRRGVSVVEM